MTIEEDITYRTLAEALLVRYPELDPVRVESGIVYAMRGQISLARFDEHNQEITPTINLYAIKSRQDKTRWYLVSPRKHTCTCPDSSIRGSVCKHRIAIYLWRELPKARAKAFSLLASRPGLVRPS